MQLKKKLSIVGNLLVVIVELIMIMIMIVFLSISISLAGVAHAGVAGVAHAGVVGVAGVAGVVTAYELCMTRNCTVLYWAYLM